MPQAAAFVERRGRGGGALMLHRDRLVAFPHAGEEAEGGGGSNGGPGWRYTAATALPEQQQQPPPPLAQFVLAPAPPPLISASGAGLGTKAPLARTAAGRRPPSAPPSLLRALRARRHFVGGLRRGRGRARCQAAA